MGCCNHTLIGFPCLGLSLIDGGPGKGTGFTIFFTVFLAVVSFWITFMVFKAVLGIHFQSHGSMAPGMV